MAQRRDHRVPDRRRGEAAPRSPPNSAWRPRAATSRTSPATSPTTLLGRLRQRQGVAVLRRRARPVCGATSGTRLGITPRGIDRENVEMMHRTHMGVDNDYVNILLHALRTALSDGWGGSMIATELSDIIFGTPTPVVSEVNLGVLRARPGEHRHARPQSRCSPTSSSAPHRTPSCSPWPSAYGANGHQHRGPVLHRQRDADAPGRAHGREPPHARARHGHRRARGDGRRLPVHHALGRRRGQVLPHPDHLDLRQGEVPGGDPRLVRPSSAAPRSPATSSQGRRGLPQPQPRAGPDPRRRRSR